MYINIESVETVKGEYYGNWILVNKEYYARADESTYEELINADVVKAAPKTSASGFKHLNPIKYYREHSSLGTTHWTKRDQ